MHYFEINTKMRVIEFSKTLMYNKSYITFYTIIILFQFTLDINIAKMYQAMFMRCQSNSKGILLLTQTI